MNNAPFFFDKIISVKLYKTKENKEYNPRTQSMITTGEVLDTDPLSVVTIDTTSGGLKPDIEFEIGELPGQNCYDCTLKIRNLMYMSDIRKYKFMSITAGYKYGASYTQSRTVTFSIAIFTGYQESPNPDGLTVFKGLTTGQVEGFLTTHRVSFHSYGEMSLNDFIERAALGASGYVTKEQYVQASARGGVGVLKVINRIPKQLGDEVMIPAQSKGIASTNGMAFLQRVYEIARDTLFTLGYTYIQQVFNGQLTVGVLECDEKLRVAEPVIDITAVYSASFTASILNISAPWNPACQPGALVRISPHYFNGQQAPNSIGDLMDKARTQDALNVGMISTEEARTGEGIYRVLKTRISFSSCRDTNKMDVMLLPIAYLKNDPSLTRTVGMYEDLRADVENSKKWWEQVNIVIGKAPADDTQSIWSGVLKGNYGNNPAYAIFPYGRSFSDLSKIYYCKAMQLSEDEVLWKSKSQYNKECVIDIRDNGTLIMGKNNSLSVGIRVGRANAWPIILKATYQRYVATKDAQYRVDMNDPDTLPANVTAVIPALPKGNEDAIAALTPDKDLFKAMADYYIQHMTSAKPWAKESAIRMYNMYLLLGGTL